MTTASPATHTATAQYDDPALPDFVRDPVRLDAGRHARTGVLPAAGYYGFAAATVMVPITVDELMPAARHYPIVFPSGAAAHPLAVLGTPGGSNRHVGHDGRWRRDCYVPGWVRRYPFVPVQGAGGRWELGVDAASQRFVADHGTTPAAALFDASGAYTAPARAAWQRCLEYVQALERTRLWVAALRRDHQLVERCARCRAVEDRLERRLHAHQVIDLLAYRDLPRSSVLAWHRHGWTLPTAVQLASQYHWQGLRQAA